MSMTRRRALGLASAFAAGSVLPVPVRAQAQLDWPNRPLRIMVGTAAGGSPDIVSRMLADKIADRLGQSIYVENNASGGGAVALSTVTRAPPDGTTLTMMTAGYSSGVSVGKFQFDPDNSFGFVSMCCAYPMVYSVPANSPIRSFAELVDRAKSAPGKITYVITSAGSVYHLLGKWVDMAAGTEMTPVAYRGTSAAVTDVLGGRVDVMLDTATSSFPRIRNGQFRVLAVTAPGSFPLMPDAPTVAATLPGVSYMSWLGLCAPPHTPQPIIARLNSEVHRALAMADVQKKLADSGNVATPTTPAEMRQQLISEIDNWKRIVVANNIKVD